MFHIIFFHLIWTGQPQPDEVATEPAVVKLVGDQQEVGVGSGEDIEEEPAEVDPLMDVQDMD